MRFPFALTKKIASHIIKHKLRKTPKFAMVLQLEPLHTCNLTCTGCGRIREYSTVAQGHGAAGTSAWQAAVECDAPMVSICGGEPLIYPKIEELMATACWNRAACFTSARTECSCGKKCATTSRQFIRPNIEPRAEAIARRKS
jgi:MoaA/NifB/PqqE/SkfB family radical SAM enzyme